MFDKLLRILTRILVAIGMTSLMGIVLTICVNIVARYIFKKPLLWSLELCSILVVWATYILFGVDYKENRHFRIEIITKILPTNALKVLDIIVDILLFIAVIVPRDFDVERGPAERTDDSHRNAGESVDCVLHSIHHRGFDPLPLSDREDCFAL